MILYIDSHQWVTERAGELVSPNSFEYEQLLEHLADEAPDTGWYFIDETENFVGPYETKAAAEAASNKLSAWLDQPSPSDTYVF